MRYCLFVPLALMIVAVVLCCRSYSVAKQCMEDDLNDAMIALVNENRERWTSPDTIVALRRMHAMTNKPMIIYQASDLQFNNSVLKDEAYFTLALVDGQNPARQLTGSNIISDSIMLVPEKALGGAAIQVQGFANCSMASVFAASDQTIPGIFFALSLLSMILIAWRRNVSCQSETIAIDGLKLTPMQRRFTRMLIEAPDMRVDKATLCAALWDNKSNAEESLYTLVRRTKSALAAAGIEIICNRGESYELRVNR